MPSFLSLKYRQINGGAILEWLHLTSPLLRKYVSASLSEEGGDGRRLLAIGAECEAQSPAGLLLAEITNSSLATQNSKQQLWIISLVVAKPFRNQGVGSALMSQATNWAKSHQLEGIHLQIPLRSSSTEPMQRLTATQQGWTASTGKVVVGLSISSSVETLLERMENVVKRQARHASWQMTPFPEQQTEKLKERIVLANNEGIAAPWDPDDEDYQWEPASQYSRLLWSQGEIIGWLITHFVSNDCLRYAKFWVDPGWERSGAPLAMLASVMRSAHFSTDTKAIEKGCFISHPTNNQLHHWIKKQFKPVSDSWIEIENRHLTFNPS